MDSHNHFEMLCPEEKCCLQNDSESHTLKNAAHSTNKTLPKSLSLTMQETAEYQYVLGEEGSLKDDIVWLSVFLVSLF